jgi:carboxypeptidase Taq
MPNVTDRYNNLIKTLREISTLDSAASLLSWDEQTFMPKKGAELRANQASLLARMSHEKFTDPWLGEILREVDGERADARALFRFGSEHPLDAAAL